jgi:hypothetical protein
LRRPIPGATLSGVRRVQAHREYRTGETLCLDRRGPGRCLKMARDVKWK